MFVNQDPIVNIDLSRFCNMKVTLFVIAEFQDIMDIIVHSSHSVKSFFCGRCRECIVVVEVYGMWIITLETSAEGEVVHSSSSGIVGQFSKR